jgi:hypothetical protein
MQGIQGIKKKPSMAMMNVAQAFTCNDYLRLSAFILPIFAVSSSPESPASLLVFPASISPLTTLLKPV